MGWWVSNDNPDIKACVSLFDIMSKASPIEINNVALLPSSKDQKFFINSEILAGLRVLDSKQFLYQFQN